MILNYIHILVEIIVGLACRLVAWIKAYQLEVLLFFFSFSFFFFQFDFYWVFHLLVSLASAFRCCLVLIFWLLTLLQLVYKPAKYTWIKVIKHLYYPKYFSRRPWLPQSSNQSRNYPLFSVFISLDKPP